MINLVVIVLLLLFCFVVVDNDDKFNKTTIIFLISGIKYESFNSATLGVGIHRRLYCRRTATSGTYNDGNYFVGYFVATLYTLKIF